MKKNLFGGILIGANLVIAAFLIMAASSSPAKMEAPTQTEPQIVNSPKTEMSQEGMIGEIRMFGGNFAPRGWALCNGQLLSISSNSALFSILGTTYGGDGRTNFALPDLRGRAAVHAGRGPGLSDYRLGAKGGSETTTLTTNNLPSHYHQVPIVPIEKLMNNNNIQPAAGGAESLVGTGHAVDHHSHSEATGGGQSFNIRQPYQAVNYIICLQGTFPSRN